MRPWLKKHKIKQKDSCHKGQDEQEKYLLSEMSVRVLSEPASSFDPAELREGPFPEGQGFHLVTEAFCSAIPA